MTIPYPPSSTLASASYAALRHGGAPAEFARRELGLDRDVALRLERTFLARKVLGCGGMRPRFAHHERHVRDVLGAGGFPVVEEPKR